MIYFFISEVCVVITNINPVNDSQKVNFQSNNTRFVRLGGETYRQIGSLREACRNILGKLQLNESLISTLQDNLSKVKISKNAIIFNITDIDAIRLAMPRGPEGNLFTIQTIKNKKAEHSVIVNNNGYLVESYCINKERFLEPENYNKNIVDKIVLEVYDSADFPLLELRKLLDKSLSNSSTTYAPNGAIIKQVPKSETENKKVVVSDPKKPFVPPSENWADFSMNEIIRQNAGLIPKTEVRPRSKYDLIKQKEKRELKNLSANVSYRPKIQIRPIEKDQKEIQKVDTEKHIQTEKRKRGRPPKVQNGVIKQQQIKTTYKEKPVKEKSIKSVAGIIPTETQSKINEIFQLISQIAENFKNISQATGIAIRASYEGFKSFRNKMSFGDLIISIPKRKDYAGHNILNITDSGKQKTLNISDSEKIISNNINWNSRGLLPKLRFFSQSEVDEKLADENYSNLIDSALINLRNFKKFLDNKDWQKSKQKVQHIESSGIINNLSMTKIQSLTEKFNNIHSFIKILPPRSSLEARKSYGQINLLKNSSKLEFINPLGDGSNVIFNRAQSRFGIYTYVIKHNNTKNLEEVFVISEDGKILKNVNRNSGLNMILPTNSNQRLKFYSQEELEQTGLQDRLDNLLNILETKMGEYELFLHNYEFKTKMTGKTALKIENQENLSLSSVKSFIDNFIKNLQEKAMNFTKTTGYKSSLTSVAEDLKTKFEDFLNKQSK